MPVTILPKDDEAYNDTNTIDINLHGDTFVAPEEKPKTPKKENAALAKLAADRGKAIAGATWKKQTLCLAAISAVVDLSHHAPIESIGYALRDSLVHTAALSTLLGVTGYLVTRHVTAAQIKKITMPMSIEKQVVNASIVGFAASVAICSVMAMTLGDLMHNKTDIQKTPQKKEIPAKVTAQVFDPRTTYVMG